MSSRLDLDNIAGKNGFMICDTLTIYLPPFEIETIDGNQMNLNIYFDFGTSDISCKSTDNGF